jgi:hypothetical protein
MNLMQIFAALLIIAGLALLIYKELSKGKKEEKSDDAKRAGGYEHEFSVWKFRLASNSTAVIIIALGIVLLLAPPLIDKIARTDAPQNDNHSATPLVAQSTLRPESATNAPSTQPPTPSSTPSPSPQIEIKLPRDEDKVASRQVDAQNRVTWHFPVAVTLKNLDPTRDKGYWISVLFHESESGQGEWWVQNSKEVTGDTVLIMDAYADDGFFHNQNRSSHIVDVQAILTETELESSSHFKKISDEGFQTFCKKGGACSSAPKTLKVYNSAPKSNLLSFPLKQQSDGQD